MKTTNRPSVEALVRAKKKPKRAGDCKHLYGAKVARADGTESERITWCCAKRVGIRLGDWRCVGLNHPDCPNTQ